MKSLLLRGAHALTCLSASTLLYIPYVSALPQEGAPHAPMRIRGHRDDSLELDGMSPNVQYASSVLLRRDYTCGPGNPCSNHACCGSSGFCGYGPTYCGTGCQSNCNAKAECGQYAETPGKTCPLNTCCSEFGFCGTTQDFCTGGCQSNCVLNPQPASGSPKNQALSKVIGYYESWSYQSSCNRKSPSDMPLNELTHLNYAFAFIEPVTFELTTMDDKTPESLFKLTTDTKKYNPNLKVYIAIGGWTFSDNDTVTQPLFSEISSTEANRQKFADNCVKFCNLWGFDGIDIDWEYPGAPDRGGKPEDVENFVLLMKTIKQTFNGAPRKLGLTFTIPSSYWYLKWFDMPNLLKYADWTNLMSYDLHGTWDANNPIGAIAQAHTNLTEIKLATQLLWRNDIKPEQVCLGFGFYGRSFQLADPSCTTPGCPFKGGAKAGPCSKTSGVLMYYEIQAILNQIPSLTPVHDEDAAVKYIVWDNDQWVSYDDGDTFDQKLAWANSVGFGGSLIWAVDTDDDKYTAMSGLMGEPVSHVDSTTAIALPALSQKSVASVLIGENGQDCKVLKDRACKAVTDLRCESGWLMLGWDRNGCPSDQGVPICCPSATAPKVCTWRGSGKDCNGQCHAGEATVALSKWGGKGHGWSGESGTGSCNRGDKAFCCTANDWAATTKGCRWTDCNGSCYANEVERAAVVECSWNRKKKYCCQEDSALYDCVWRGSNPDCADAKCNLGEVAIINSQNGDNGWKGCLWSRKKTNCCKVRKPPGAKLECNKTTCDDDPLVCAADEDKYGNYKRSEDGEFRGSEGITYVEDADDLSDDNDSLSEDNGGLSGDATAPATNTSRRGVLEKRKRRGYSAWFNGIEFLTKEQFYGSQADYMRSVRNGLVNIAQAYWWMRSRTCSRPSLGPMDYPLDSQGNRIAPSSAELEHLIPASFVLGRFVAISSNGRLMRPLPFGNRRVVPDGDATTTARTNTRFWQDIWNAANQLPANDPEFADVDTPAEYIAEAIGSSRNRQAMVLLQSTVNGLKGRLEVFNNPVADTRFRTYIRQSTRDANETAVELMMANLRETIAVFEYLNDNEIASRTADVAAEIRRRLVVLEARFPDAQGIVDHWDQAYTHYFGQVSEFARDWLYARVQQVRTAYQAVGTPFRDYVLDELKIIESKISDCYYPFEKPKNKNQ
ncbi:hypothetical protein OQA88_2390 [Cercophora sp. LCS_1]